MPVVDVDKWKDSYETEHARYLLMRFMIIQSSGLVHMLKIINPLVVKLINFHLSWSSTRVMLNTLLDIIQLCDIVYVHVLKIGFNSILCYLSIYICLRTILKYAYFFDLTAVYNMCTMLSEKCLMYYAYLTC